MDDSENWKDWDLSYLSNTYQRNRFLPRPADYIIEQRGTIHSRFANDPQFMASLRSNYCAALSTKLVSSYMQLHTNPDSMETEVSLRIMVLTPGDFYRVVEAEVERHLGREREMREKIRP